MAEGGKRSRSFKESFSKASGDADEVFCEPCKSDDEWKAVVGYCPICDEYLCDNCLKVHRNQKMTRAHAILDKNQMPSVQRSVANKDLCVEVCQAHHPEIVRFYCKAHDQPGCGDCMTLDHTACLKDRILDIADGFQETKEFKNIDQQLQQLHREVEEIGSELDNNMKNLDKAYQHIIQKIASIRKQINSYLDQMEKNLTDEAAQMKKEDETKLKKLQSDNQAIKIEIEGMLKKIHSSNVNMNSLFVTAKQAKQKLATMEKECDNIKQPQQQLQDFHISNEIENTILAKTPLGKLSRGSSQYHQNQRILTIEATHNRSICVKDETDKEQCYITDCTLLSAHLIVVIDRNNTKVKLVDISNDRVISSFRTSSTPFRVTALSTNMIAVTLGPGKIQVFKVTSTFTLQKKLKIQGGYCYGIAYKDLKFAVSHPGRIEVRDIQGEILHTMQPQRGHENILLEPYYITFGHDNDTVIVSDIRTNNVSLIAFSGEILDTYIHPCNTLEGPCGIQSTVDGVLFVCSIGNQCIHVISPDFKTSKIIIKKDGHVVCPRSITYCDINHKLYISNTLSVAADLYSQIQVYDLYQLNQCKA